MQQIIYTSMAADGLGSGEVFNIVEKSAGNNAQNDLTGFLVFSSGRFFQVLEGSREAIDELVAKLWRDERHHSIEIVHRSSIKKRVFPKWMMKRLMPTNDLAALIEMVPELKNAPTEISDALDCFLAPGASAQAA